MSRTTRPEPSGHVVAAMFALCMGMVFAVLSNAEKKSEDLAFLRYCERVEVYMETDGEFGHRDYRDLWHECRSVLYAKL